MNEPVKNQLKIFSSSLTILENHTKTSIPTHDDLEECVKIFSMSRADNTIDEKGGGNFRYWSLRVHENLFKYC
jgi:hypothetical protein